MARFGGDDRILMAMDLFRATYANPASHMLPPGADLHKHWVGAAHAALIAANAFFAAAEQFNDMVTMQQEGD